LSFLAALLQFLSPNFLASSITLFVVTDLYKDKAFHEPILRSLDRSVGRRILDSPAIASLDFSAVLFSGAGFQPCVQPSAILEDRLDCFLVWVFITDQSGLGGPASSYANVSVAPWLIRPHKPHHQRQGHAISRWRLLVILKTTSSSIIH
jgi:hypothetical protein